MNELTPAQRRVIQTWTEERDALLRDIGIYSTELEEKKKANAAAGLAFADLERSIAEARGRIAELYALEERARTSLATDVAELEVRKSRLEGECKEQEVRLATAKDEHAVVVSTTATLTAANDTMKDQAAIVKSVVSDVIETSKVASSDMKIIMTEIRDISTKVIDKANENISQTGIILEKLPRYIFELQKPIPIRRTFHAPRGTVIAPEIPVEATQVQS